MIDDEHIVAATLRRLLQRDHDVLTMTDAREALDLLAEGERFDVILCDLMMPVMDGMELYAELAASVPEQAARIVFLTGGAFSSGARAFLASIANPSVEKPFSIQSLRELISERLQSPVGEASSSP